MEVLSEQGSGKLLSRLNIPEVSRFLHQIDLKNLIQKFVDNEVTGDMLVYADSPHDFETEEYGFVTKNRARKLYGYVQELKVSGQSWGFRRNLIDCHVPGCISGNKMPELNFNAAVR